MPTRRRFIHTLIIAGGLPLAALAREQQNTLQHGTPVSEVVRGHVVCLTEELQREQQIVPDCDKRGHVYSLRTSAGQILTFLPTDTAAAVYDDVRIRERELLVTARPIAGTSFIEVIKLQSVRNGKVYDLFYYCDVCNISTHKPGPCVCCQEPVVFHEEPADEQSRP